MKGSESVLEIQIGSNKDDKEKRRDSLKVDSNNNGKARGVLPVQSFANPLSYWTFRIPRPPILSSHLFTFSKSPPSSNSYLSALATGVDARDRPGYEGSPRVTGWAPALTIKELQASRLHSKRMSMNCLRRGIWVGTLLALVGLAQPVWSQPSPKLPRYDLSVVLDVPRHLVHVREVVTWTNTSRVPVTELVFNAHAHYSIPDQDIGFLAKTAELLRMSPKEAM